MLLFFVCDEKSTATILNCYQNICNIQNSHKVNKIPYSVSKPVCAVRIITAVVIVDIVAGGISAAAKYYAQSCR